tara:strand:- start:1299 stop:2570 length:1272 start_codon:yes stop_codon:yes gene_type:complete
MNRQKAVLEEEKRIRKWIRKILEEEDKNQSKFLYEGLVDTFVTPFTDVFNAAKVGSKMILSAAVLNLEMFFSFSEKRRLETWNKYNTRKTKIEAEWKEAMANTEAYWNGEKGDMGLVAFMVNPAGAIGMSLGASAVQAGVGTAKFAAEAGIVPSSIQGLFDSETAGQEPERGPIGSALHSLASLFFVAHHAPDGQLLSEGEPTGDKEAKKKKEDPEEELEKLFKASGVQEKMEAQAKEVIEARKEFTDEIVNAVKSQFEVIEGLASASDFPSFKEVIDKAAADAPELAQGAGLDKVEAQVKTDVDKILNNPEARQEMVAVLAEKEGIKPEKDENGEEKFPDLPDEKLIPEIEKSVFVKIKEGLQAELGEGVGKLKESALEALKEGEPSEDDKAIMSGTPLGQEMIKVIEDGVAEIENLGGTSD